jgi:hypothetical protein
MNIEETKSTDINSIGSLWKNRMISIGFNIPNFLINFDRSSINRKIRPRSLKFVPKWYWTVSFSRGIRQVDICCHFDQNKKRCKTVLATVNSMLRFQCSFYLLRNVCKCFWSFNGSGGIAIEETNIPGLTDGRVQLCANRVQDADKCARLSAEEDEVLSSFFARILATESSVADCVWTSEVEGKFDFDEAEILPWPRRVAGKLEIVTDFCTNAEFKLGISRDDFTFPLKIKTEVRIHSSLKMKKVHPIVSNVT